MRRGSEKAEIYSIAFDPTSTFLACSSDRGTIHIFSIASAQKVLISKNKGEKVEVEKSDENDVPKNQKSIFGKVSKFLFLPNFFNSEWSFAQFKINESRSICSFGPNNSIIGMCIFLLIAWSLLDYFFYSMKFFFIKLILYSDNFWWELLPC